MGHLLAAELNAVWYDHGKHDEKLPEPFCLTKIMTTGNAGAISMARCTAATASAGVVFIQGTIVSSAGQRIIDSVGFAQVAAK